MNDNDKSGVATDSEINVVSMLAVLWRYKWLVAGVALIFTLLAVWMSMVAPFVYRAEVTMTPV